MTAQEALANKVRVQEEARDSWVSTPWGCLELATGCGKTKIGLDCWAAKGYPKLLIVVPTEEMRDTDWPEEAVKWGYDLKDVKVVCYAVLGKQDLTKYEMIIFDECHRLTEPNLRNIDRLRYLSSMPYRYRSSMPYKVLGLTATMPTAAYEEQEQRVAYLKELFPTRYKLSTDEAVDLGLISDFHVHVLKFELDTKHANIPGGTKAKPFMQTEASRYKYLTSKLQKAMITKNKNFIQIAIGERARFIYNLDSKLRLGKHCLEKLRETGKRNLIFAGSIEQANTLCGDNVYHSDSTREALDRFQRAEIDELGAVKALNEGKNLYKPDNGLILQVDSVDRNLVQRIGRLVRVRYDDLTHKALIVILVAVGTADEKWYNLAIKDFDSKRITETLVRVPDPTTS